MTADGFTLVEPRRKMKRGDEDEGEQPKKKKTEGLTDFYRFQVREGKRQGTFNRFGPLHRLFHSSRMIFVPCGRC
jgi:hypothetical protein